MAVPALRSRRHHMPMRYPLRLAELRKKRQLHQWQVAEIVGVEQPTYQRWESGKRKPDLEQIGALAEAFGVQPGELFSSPELVPLGPQLFVKGEVAAGVWRDAWEVPPDEWEAFTGRSDVSAPARERFGLRVVGDSMNEIYPPGTILECVAYTGQDIPNGKRVVVQRQREGDGFETTVKEFVCDEEGVVWLVPRSRNPAFQAPFRADAPDPGISRIEIIGIVVASVRPE